MEHNGNETLKGLLYGEVIEDCDAVAQSFFFLTENLGKSRGEGTRTWFVGTQLEKLL